MEARLARAAFLVAAVLSLGAGYRTQNFIVTAQTPQLAREMCEAAERYRGELAVEWLGEELPPWDAPCPVTISVGPHLGAGGATQFSFAHGRPFDWVMNIQGSRERLLDSVLPHEITHTIFATHFGRPLPRWADEGACTTVEHVSEKSKQQTMLIDFLTTGRGIAFNQMFAMTEYPPDVLPLYAQGYSLARFLIAQGGKRRFINYVGDGMRNDDWTSATNKHYGYRNLSELQLTWLDWVRRGSPAQAAPATLIAQQSDPVVTPPSAPPAAPSEPIAPRSPATALAAAGSGESMGGWYARVRDSHVSGAGDEPVAGGRSPTAAPAPERLEPIRPLTRPQPVGRPQLVVLEWMRQPPPTATTAPAPPPPAGAVPSHYLTTAPSGTVWR